MLPEESANPVHPDHRSLVPAEPFQRRVFAPFPRNAREIERGLSLDLGQQASHVFVEPIERAWIVRPRRGTGSPDLPSQGRLAFLETRSQPATFAS